MHGKTKQKQDSHAGRERQTDKRIVVNRRREKLMESKQMQRQTGEKEGHTEGDRKNIRSPAKFISGNIDRNVLVQSHTTNTVCVG